MTATDRPLRRWDPVVRLTHWVVALAVLLNAVVIEKGGGPHVWVGYALAATLALRLIWGFFGPPEARFSAFPPSPRRALAHVRDIAAGRVTQHASHNPLGALMVYAIWTTLAVIVVTGVLMANGPEARAEAAPPTQSLAALTSAPVPRGEEEGSEEAESGEGEEGEGGEGEEGPLGEAHEAAATLLYVLILLHIAGVLFETRRSGQPIVRRMLPGGAPQKP
jgi:cytochrome b